MWKDDDDYEAVLEKYLVPILNHLTNHLQCMIEELTEDGYLGR